MQRRTWFSFTFSPIPHLNDTIIIESNTLANGNNRMYIITFLPWINNKCKSVFYYSNLIGLSKVHGYASWKKLAEIYVLTND